MDFVEEPSWVVDSSALRREAGRPVTVKGLGNEWFIGGVGGGEGKGGSDINAVAICNVGL